LVERTALVAEKGSSWENGYIESFNGKLRDELLNGEIFYSLREAQIVIELMALALQHDPLTLFARLPAPGARSLHAPGRAARSAAVAAKLTLHVVPSVGAGQCVRGAKPPG